MEHVLGENTPLLIGAVLLVLVGALPALPAVAGFKRWLALLVPLLAFGLASAGIGYAFEASPVLVWGRSASIVRYAATSLNEAKEPVVLVLDGGSYVLNGVDTVYLTEELHRLGVSAAVVKIASAVDGNGKITHWDHDIWAAGTRSAELLYEVPNVRLRAFMGRGSAGGNLHPFGTGPWRAPGAGTNVFAKESQIDIMAAAAKVDPLEFRLRNTSNERVRRVLKAAADAFGWKGAAGPSGQGRGIAVSEDAGALCAICAEVAVDKKTGAINVKRLVAAQDMGIVINPDGAKMQMEGCMTQGLGYVLSEELNFKGGDILDRNFDTYELPRFTAVPRMETILIKNDDLAPQGGGEPAIVPLGAAIANAVFDATGVRIYRLPMTAQRVKAAMA